MTFFSRLGTAQIQVGTKEKIENHFDKIKSYLLVVFSYHLYDEYKIFHRIDF